MKIAESYSVIVIPKDRAKVRRWILSRERIVGTLVFLSGLVLFVSALGFGFIHYRRAHVATAELRQRGQHYERERIQVLAHLNELESQIEQNQQLVARLETVVGIPLAAMAENHQPTDLQPAALDTSISKTTGQEADLFDETTLRAYNLRSIDLNEQAKEVGDRLENVYQFNGEAEYFWSSLPMIAPVQGWVTSDFGLRRSPLSGRRQLHEGVDIASTYGSAVIATGDGVVTFAGRYGGLGQKIVLDHGYGLATVYGHNSQILVSDGERVERGQIIARVGSSGRSTGPHLHYEVLVNGIPIDPRHFLLEQL